MLLLVHDSCKTYIAIDSVRPLAASNPQQAPQELLTAAVITIGIPKNKQQKFETGEVCGPNE